MSKQKLKAFLTKIEQELSAPGGSEAFRRYKANKRIHTFNFKELTIRKTMKKLLDSATSIEGSGDKILKSIEKDFDEALQTLTNSVRASFNQIANGDDVVFKKGSRSGNHLIILVKDFQGVRGQRDNFSLIQKAYKKHLEVFYQTVVDLLDAPIIRKSSSNKTGETSVDTAGKAFNLEHMKNSSNIKAFINTTIYEALNEMYNVEDKEELAILNKDLKKLGIKGALQVEKNLKTGQISVFLGSQILNVAESAGERKLSTDLQNKLQKALERLDVLSVEGSDSLVSAKRKKVIKSTLDPFRKINNVTVTSENTDVEGVISLSKKDITPGSVKKTKKGSSGLSKKKVKSTRKKPLSSTPLSLIAQINRELPAQIRQNMQYPRLENRTGRFSESAKIIGVVETPRGFPSFQYTYQKYPYQTFEPGYAQGSVERDPRSIINKSIREIAAELAVGRFYTRRI